MLDVMIASALNRFSTRMSILEKNIVEEQRAQKYDHTRRTDLMKHFHAPRAYESVQLTLSIRLQNDDVQDFRCQMVSGTIISR